MALKMALLLTTRNKVRHTAAAVKSMFLQEGPPIELLLSDSGSDDGTATILDDMARGYAGPHTVRRLDCPCAQSPGIPGMNAHVNWAVTQTDADVIMQLSGDDYDFPRRALATREAYEAHKPSMVCVSQYYVTEGMEYQGETPHSTEDRWLTFEDMTVKLMGGSTCQAWDREFWEKIGGLEGMASMDVQMPPLAVLDRGAWLVQERLHSYRKCLSEQNTGLEGIYYSYDEKDVRRIQTAELMHFQIAQGYYTVVGKMDKAGLRTEEASLLLANAILDRCASWVACRMQMSLDKIPPIPFRI